MAPKRKPIDDVLLGASGMLFAGLSLWALLGGVGEAAPPLLPEPNAAGRYQHAAIANPETATEIWAAPTAAGGDEWLFDVFTPPVIYYDVVNHAFSVTPPDTVAGDASGLENAFGIELVEVKRTPYRIQLVGYVGSEGDYIVTFEDLETGETFLARPGRTIEEHSVALRSFAVDKTRDESGGGTAVQDTRATAVIHDLRQNHDVTLVQKVRFMNVAALAVFRVTGELARHVEGRQGGTVATAEATYIIGMVSFDPPTVEVTREATVERGIEVRRLEPAPAIIAPTAVPPGFMFPAASSEQNPFGEP